MLVDLLNLAQKYVACRFLNNMFVPDKIRVLVQWFE